MDFMDDQELSFNQNLIVGLKSGLLDGDEEIRVLKGKLLNIYLKNVKLQDESRRMEQCYVENQRKMRTEIDTLTKDLEGEKNRNLNLNFQLEQIRALSDEKIKEIEKMKNESAKVSKVSQNKEQRSKYSVMMRELRKVLKKRCTIPDICMVNEIENLVYGKSTSRPNVIPNVDVPIQIKILPSDLSPALSESCSIPSVPEKLHPLSSPSESGYTSDSNEPNYSMRNNDDNAVTNVSDPISFSNVLVPGERGDEPIESQPIDINSVTNPSLILETKPAAEESDTENKTDIPISRTEPECIVSIPETKVTISDHEETSLETRNITEGNQHKNGDSITADSSSLKPEAVDHRESGSTANENCNSQVYSSSAEQLPVDKKLSENNVEELLREVTKDLKPAHEMESLRKFYEENQSEQQKCEIRKPLELDVSVKTTETVTSDVNAKTTETVPTDTSVETTETVTLDVNAKTTETVPTDTNVKTMETVTSDVIAKTTETVPTDTNVKTTETVETDGSESRKIDDILQFLEHLQNWHDKWLESHVQLEEFARKLESEWCENANENLTNADADNSAYIVVLETTESGYSGSRSPDVRDEILNEWIETDALNEIDFANIKADPQNCDGLEYTTASSPSGDDVFCLENTVRRIHIEANDRQADSVVCWMDEKTEPKRVHVSAGLADEAKFEVILEKRCESLTAKSESVTTNDEGSERDSEDLELVIDEEIECEEDDSKVVMAEHQSRSEAATGDTKGEAQSEKPVNEICRGRSDTVAVPGKIGTPIPGLCRPARYNLRQKSTLDYAALVNITHRKRSTPRIDIPPCKKLPRLEPGVANPSSLIDEEKQPSILPKFNAVNSLSCVKQVELPTTLSEPSAANPSNFKDEKLSWELLDLDAANPLDLEENKMPLALPELDASNPVHSIEKEEQPSVSSELDAKNLDSKTNEKSVCRPKFYVENKVKPSEPVVSPEKTHFEHVWSRIKYSNIVEPKIFNLQESTLVPCGPELLKTAFNFRTENVPRPNKEKVTDYKNVKRCVDTYLRANKVRPYLANMAMAKFIASVRLVNRTTICCVLETVLLKNEPKVTCEIVASLCMSIDNKVHADFVDTMKVYLKEKMFAKTFKVGNNSNSLNMISTIHLQSSLYTLLCKMTGTREDAVNLLYESLMSLKNRAHPIAYSVLEHWPGVLLDVQTRHPCKKLLVSIILFCLVHHRMEYNVAMYKVKVVQELILEQYSIRLGDKTAEEYARDTLLDIRNECWIDAIVLLCKRQMFSWTYTNVVTRYFLPLLRVWKTDTVQDALLLKVTLALRRVLQACSYDQGTTCTYNFDAIITTLSDILCNDRISSRALKETVYLVMCELSPRSFPLCSQLLSSWTPPDGRMSHFTLCQLNAVMRGNKWNYKNWVSFVGPANARRMSLPFREPRKFGNVDESETGQQKTIPVGVTRASQTTQKKKNAKKNGKKKKKKKKENKEMVT